MQRPWATLHCLPFSSFLTTELLESFFQRRFGLYTIVIFIQADDGVDNETKHLCSASTYRLAQVVCILRTYPHHYAPIKLRTYFTTDLSNYGPTELQTNAKGA